MKEALASYLSPDVVLSLIAPVLPTKPGQVTSSLVGRAYITAGRASACLHTMALMQAYKADFSKSKKAGPSGWPQPSSSSSYRGSLLETFLRDLGNRGDALAQSPPSRRSI